MRTTHYYCGDVSLLIQRSPYMALLGSSSAAGFVERMAQTGLRYQSILAQYPSVKFLPLDEAHWYETLRSLGALDLPLLKDLCSLGYRGVIVAAWLAILKPDPAWEPVLRRARRKGAAPQQELLVALALAETRGVAVPAFASLQKDLRTIRRLLAPLTRPDQWLRRSPGWIALIQLGMARRRMVRAYRRGGADAALAVFRESAWQRYRPRR